MSEIKTLEVEVTHPDILDVDVDFGQTLTKIVAPEHYMGPFEFHVSDEDQVIPVKDKTPAEDITIKAIKTDPITITENGDYFPPPSRDGFSEVVVDIPIGEWSAPTLIYEGDFGSTTNTFAATVLPNGEPFAFDRIVIELSNVLQGQNVNKRTYWRSDLPMTGNPEQMIFDNGSQYWQGNTYSAISTMTIEDDTYISVSTIKEISKVSTAPFFIRKEHGGYDKITAYGWWSWNCPVGAHIKITGYDRTS